MKTLDEVIKAFDWCCNNDSYECDECPYDKEEEGCHQRNLDALHYLKEYKNKQNVGTMMFALHNTNKTVCDDCWLSREMAGEGFKQIYKKYIEEKNPPLTWEELKTMEGKPVWVEEQYSFTDKWYGYWEVISSFFDDEFVDDPDPIVYMTDEEIRHKEYLGKTWQAYRKERS